MHVEHGQARAAFLEGLGTLVDVAESLDDRQLLSASRCHGWNVCDVLVHVHLGLQEMLLGVVAPTGTEPDTDAASYWRGSPPSTDAGADEVDAIRFARRVASAYRLPRGLVAHLRMTADGVGRAVADMQPGAVDFQARVLSTGDFLATWAVEVAVHHLDLGRDLTLPGPPAGALRLARTTIQELAGGPLPATWSDEHAVLVGAGRQEIEPPDAASGHGAVLDALPVL